MSDPALPPPEEYPFWSWEDLLLMVGLLLPILLITGAGTFLLEYVLPGFPRVKALLPLLATFSLYGLWFGALYGVIKLRYDRPFWRSLAWTRPALGYVRAAVSGMAMAGALMLLLAALRPPEIKTEFQEMLSEPASLLLIGFFAVTLGPLCEELVFRGLLMPLVIRALGPLAGIAIAAAPFALLHGRQYAWSWKLLLVIFLAGAGFGWMRHRSGSTAAAAVMHAGYNLMQFALGIIAQTQGHTR